MRSSGRRRSAPWSYTVTSSDSLRRRAMPSKVPAWWVIRGPRREYRSVMDTQNESRILAAEVVGTLVLMLGGPGVAILLPALGLLPGGDASVGATILKLLVVSLSFGFSLLVMWYVLAPISGCHLNPAVTLGMLLAR